MWGPESVSGPLPVHESHDEVAGDGLCPRHEPFVRVGAIHHLRHFIALKPARILDFGGINGDGPAFGLRQTAQHQRHRKRPGLAFQIAHARNRDSGFFHRLAAHGIFQRFARFHKAGKATVHIGPELRGAPQQAALARNHQHDDSGVRARKMLAATGGTIPPPAGIRHLRAGAAIGAEAMPPMPCHQGLCTGQRSKPDGGHQPLRCNGAQIADLKARRLHLFLTGRIEGKGEVGRIIRHAQKDRATPAPDAGLFHRKQKLTHGPQRDRLTANQAALCLRVRQQGGCIRAQMGGAIQRIPGIGEGRAEGIRASPGKRLFGHGEP